MKKNFKKNRQKGFSFLEVMLVVFILGTTLTVFVGVISKSIGHSTASRDTIIAASLAQEGVELVRNVRDNNWIQAKTNPAVTAFTGIGSDNTITNATINYNPVTLTAGTGKLKLDANGYYTTLGTQDTKFSRRIIINGQANINERKITSLVVWGRLDFPATTSCNAANKCVYAEITLTKWGG